MTPIRRENRSDERARSAAPAGSVAPPVKTITPFIVGDDEAGRCEPVQREQRRHHAEGAADEHRARVVEARADDRQRNTCCRRGEGGETDRVEMDVRVDRHGVVAHGQFDQGRKPSRNRPQDQDGKEPLAQPHEWVVGRKPAKL